MYYSISAASTRGGRKYMEDRMILEQFVNSESRLAGLFFAILDGHGGPHASEHVRRVLWPTIKATPGFMSVEDADVLAAMKSAFLRIHEEMRTERDHWPQRPNGFASTAGTTCSCVFIREDKIYTAHCGDSRILLVTGEDADVTAVDLTHDHKPDDPTELERIEKVGGAVTRFTPVSRVIWKREVEHADGRKQYETIPFLSIARSLGDYWSFVPETETYAVSPMPDCAVRRIDKSRDKFLVLISDGITHVLQSKTLAEYINEWRKGLVRNIARFVIKEGVTCWNDLKSDNMSAICVGLHSDDEEFTFTKTHDLDFDSNLAEYLTTNQRDILLLHSDRLYATAPHVDDVVIRRAQEENVDVYVGPGFIDEYFKPENKDVSSVCDRQDFELVCFSTILVDNLDSTESSERPLKRKSNITEELEAKRTCVRL